MATKRAAAKAATKKRAPRKSRATKAKTRAPKQTAGPKEVEIKGELRYKLEAMQLKIDNRKEEISAPLLAEQQQAFNNALARTLRNDIPFKKLSDEWRAMLDVADAKYSPDAGYKLHSLNPSTGVLTFVHDPEA